MHLIYLIHEFHNLRITEINSHNIQIYWDAPVYIYIYIIIIVYVNIKIFLNHVIITNIYCNLLSTIGSFAIKSSCINNL